MIILRPYNAIEIFLNVETTMLVQILYPNINAKHVTIIIIIIIISIITILLKFVG